MIQCSEDYLELLNKSMKYDRRLKKQGASADGTDKVKIAVLGSFSTQFFTMTLRYLLHENGVDADIYEGEYRSINQAVLDSSSDFYRFGAEIVIMLPFYEDITEKPFLFDENETVKQKAEETVSFYVGMWKRISEELNCQILFSNFVIPPLRSLGQLEANYCFSETHFMKCLNLLLEERRLPNVTIIDMEWEASCIGKNRWFDFSAYYLNKAGFSMECLPEAVRVFVNPVLALRGKTKKCLVLDLDNTLWGGVVGELGYDGIELNPNQAEGEAYRAFQKYILGLKNRGVILAVCSKNDDAVAREPFEKNENMLIHSDDISCFMANWDDKATNIRAIASKLNIGTDSMVFVDDNPAEREIIRSFLPEVTVIDLPEDVAEYSSALERAKAFDWMQITKDDIGRTKYYRDSGMRDEFRLNYTDYDEYLKALNMTGGVYRLDSENTSRFVQLVNKSNQFNVRTRRYHEAEIENMLRDENYRLLYVKISDRFSDYGLISCVILKKIGDSCFIDTWLMSCRVLKRRIENLVCERIIEEAREWKCSRVIGEFIPTAKNALVKDLFSELGFSEYTGTEPSKTVSESTMYVMETEGGYATEYPIKTIQQ